MTCRAAAWSARLVRAGEEARVLVNWGEAFTVSAIGIANVFIVLAILWLAVYGVGLAVQRAEKRK